MGGSRMSRRPRMVGCDLAAIWLRRLFCIDGVVANRLLRTNEPAAFTGLCK